jgi:hypothetical protein
MTRVMPAELVPLAGVFALLLAWPRLLRPDSVLLTATRDQVQLGTEGEGWISSEEAKPRAAGRIFTNSTGTGPAWLAADARGWVPLLT